METVQNGAASFSTQLDSQGRATQIAEGTGLYPVGFTYNADNLVTQASFPGGVTVGRQYDGANRLTEATINAPAGGLHTTYGYGYDPTGWLNRISTGGSLVGASAPAPTAVNLTSEGTTDWAEWGSYTSANIAYRKAGGSQIANSYFLSKGGTVNAASFPTSFSWSDGSSDPPSGSANTGVALSTFGQTLAFTVAADLSPRTLHVYVGAFDGNHSTLSATLSDGSAPAYVDATLISSSSTTSTVREYTFTYQAASSGQTLTVTLTNNNGGGDVRLAAATLAEGGISPLTHDGLGHLTGANDGVHPALTWSYDGQGNLLSEVTGGITTTYTYAAGPNTANELAGLAAPGQPSQDYTYDPYGNTLSIGPSPSNPCPSGTSTCLGYDAQARLSSVAEPNNGPTIALTYNAMGLRASYTVTPYGQSQPSLSEQFTYRGGQLAQTVVVTGTTSYTDTYVYSQHGLPLELLRTSNGVLARYWYLRDGLGNVVALTDANGTVVDQYAYDLWGKPTLVQESVPQQLRYQGYWYDNDWRTAQSFTGCAACRASWRPLPTWLPNMCTVPQ